MTPFVLLLGAAVLLACVLLLLLMKELRCLKEQCLELEKELLQLRDDHDVLADFSLNFVRTHE